MNNVSLGLLFKCIVVLREAHLPLDKRLFIARIVSRFPSRLQHL